MTDRDQTTRCYRAWLELVDEFPELRWDLDAKLDYFICWRLANERA